MFFGLVRKTESTVASKYSVRTYPTLILLKQGQKPIKYKGAMKYKEIFEFMNTYSETFNFGEADISEESIASKPWMSDPFPEMNEESKDDISEIWKLTEYASHIAELFKEINDLVEDSKDQLLELVHSSEDQVPTPHYDRIFRKIDQIENIYDEFASIHSSK